MNKRTSQINFRANELERQALENMALKEGRGGVSEMIRELVREGAQRRGCWPSNTQHKKTEPAR